MRWCGGCSIGVLLLLFVSSPSRLAAAAPPALPPSSILIEASSGEVLAAQDADSLRDPGSFSELMVLLLALERAAIENLPLDVPVTVSAQAAAGGGLQRSRLVIPLRSDRAYLLSDLMKATLVSAAESAALGVAEAIAGSVPVCVEAMNQRAQMLGMSATHFAGLAGVSVEPGGADKSTARDLARLARALVNQPQVLAWSSLPGLPFDQGTVLLRNANSLVGAVRGVDGLQVSTHDGRFGVIATAKRGAMRLIAVVLQASDGQVGYRTASELLESGFAKFNRVEVVRAGERLKVSVAIDGGKLSNIVPVATESFSVLRTIGEARRLTLRYQLPEVLFAPIHEGERIGELIIEEQGELIAVVPVASPVDVPSSGLMSIAVR